MIVGFFFTISYKSVLRAMMMNVYYDNTIETIDDMLASERTFMLASDTILPHLLASDPRTKVKALAERVQYYKHGTGVEEEYRNLFEG